MSSCSKDSASGEPIEVNEGRTGKSEEGEAHSPPATRAGRS